jgi:eukaryotic-like serine/threonine-protein kinase
MPAPVTVKEFLELLPKSGVVEPTRLDTYVESLRATDALAGAPSQVGDMMVRDGLLTQFQVQQLLLGKYLGFTIGNYQILELLGSGGMSAVYLCEHRTMRHRVAIKVLPKAMAKDPTLLKRFYREARASAALHHPNIVRGFEADSERNQHFLVMEYVDGASLQEVVRNRGPLAVPRAADYIRQAALGLHYAHEQGLVHRDIKPGNLLVDRAGTIKILDMGLSRFYNEEESILTRDVLGTLDYLAPEQARDSHSVDIRADIYSLGGTFYFLLTGQAPFGAGRLDPQAIAQQSKGPVSIRNHRPDVPEALALVVDRMLAFTPEKRYQTPAAVAEALAPWTKTPIPPPSEAEMPRLSQAVQCPPSVLKSATDYYATARQQGGTRWLLIGACLLLVIGVGVALWLTLAS